jgi:hypothetical protein
MKNQINKAIFKYLDCQNFTIIENTNKIYFVNSESEKYAQISYNKTDGWCYISWLLIDEISALFSTQKPDSKEIIGRWVENTLQIKSKNTWSEVLSPSVHVENDLQMRVTNTQYPTEIFPLLVENDPQMRVTNTEAHFSNSHTVFVDNTLQFRVTNTRYSMYGKSIEVGNT